MYTIIFKKGKIELELTTEDKYLIERQLDMIIRLAGKKTVSQHSEPINDNNIIRERHVEPIEEHHAEVAQSGYEVVKPAEFKHVTQEETQASLVNKEDVIPSSLDIGSVRPVTINSLQNPEPEPQPDFDKILNTEMNSHSTEVPIDKDEKFIQYVEGKSALDKLDFLVLTAQYFAHNENMNTFNLKHINAKLMQNFTLIVDHSVLQSAISKEFITQVHQGNDEISSEYMLTEKGLRSY